MDQPSASDWDRQLAAFDDASIYQTWAYGATRWGVASLEHVRLMRGGQPVAMAQVALRHLPLLGGGLAYIPWGPVWRKNGGDINDLREIVQRMRHEYAVHRGYLLRIVPRERDDADRPVGDVYATEGFQRVANGYRTLLVDLRGPFDELEHRINRSWRRALKRAAQLHVTVEEGVADAQYQTFTSIYRDMVRRKGFLPGVNIDEFARIQRALSGAIKMHILVARMGERAVAALMASHMGDTGVGLLGATAMDGLSCGAFHLLNMRMMRWLKDSGARYYDFGGYDPHAHDGTAAFKSGLPGEIIHFLGRMEASNHPVRAMIVHRAEQGRHLARTIRSAARTGRRAIGARRNPATVTS